MAFVSVTRLRPRRLRFLPAIILHSWRSRRQLRGTNGFIGGYLASGPRFTLWTVTVWTDQAAMQAFRTAAAHLKAMPALIGSCDEAAVVHWESATPAIPAPAEAAERMRQGKTSKVRHPSPAHAAGQPWPDGRVPVRGPQLLP